MFGNEAKINQIFLNHKKINLQMKYQQQTNHMKYFFYISFFLLSIFSNISVYGQRLEIDRYLGEENAKTVKNVMGIYEDTAMTKYLNDLGQKLVSHLEKPLFKYQFKLVTDFTLLGGYIYVTTGLIPLLESEDELACILAHKIVHSNNRHSIKKIKKILYLNYLKSLEI